MSLPKLKSRHRSIKSLNSILTALQMVTVVRMQRTRGRFEAAKSYLDPIRPIIKGRLELPVLTKKIMVIVTSNRGLCAGFNKQVVAKAIEFAKSDPDWHFVMLGRRGVELLRFMPEYAGRTVFADFESVERIDSKRISDVFQKIKKLNAEIYIASNIYKSAVVQIPQVKALYPVPEELKGSASSADFIMEPEEQQLIGRLTDHYLEVLFYQLLLNSQLGELAARLMVLKGAVDNSKDLIAELSLAVNKARQSVITRDLLEIISSAEALRSDHE